MKEVLIGKQHTVSAVVSEDLLACAMGSGDLPVYATPAMVALMEQASAELLNSFLDEEETSVGIAIAVNHLAATIEGKTVTATAMISAVDRKKVSFSVRVFEGEKEIGNAVHDRFIVNADKFLEKAQQA